MDSWSIENKRLLRGWADNAITYRWLHHRTSSRYSHRSQALTIIISIFSYFSGGSVLSTNFDNTWFKYMIGYIAIFGGILTNINGLVAWKALAEKHKVISAEFSAFERSISSMITINSSQRVDAIEFINIKRIEYDTLIANAPNIPQSIIKQYETKFTKQKLSNFWVSFYYIFCCNKKLLGHLLGEQTQPQTQLQPQPHYDERIFSAQYVKPEGSISSRTSYNSNLLKVSRQQQQQQQQQQQDNNHGASLVNPVRSTMYEPRMFARKNI